MMADIVDVRHLCGIEHGGIKGITIPVSGIYPVQQMADTLLDPLWKNFVWRHQISKNLVACSGDPGTFAVNPLKAEPFEKEKGPGVGFQIAIFQHTRCPHGYPDFPVGNHLDFRLRPVKLVVDYHMKRKGGLQTMSCQEILHGRDFFTQPACNQLLAFRIIQKQTVNFHIDLGKIRAFGFRSCGNRR